MSSRILITGASGFVGQHLTNLLVTQGHQVLAVGGHQFEHAGYHHVAPIDINDRRALTRLLGGFQPDAIVHLAALSSVAAAWLHPEDVIQVNTLGTLSLISAIAKAAPKALLVSFGSAEEYGGTSDAVRHESDPTLPNNPYGVSKLAQGLLVRQMAVRHGFRVCHLRPFNLIGPGQGSQFVIADWASQIASIERGERDPLLYVGNTDVVRDFLDVRDACRAVTGLLTLADPAPIYNLCSGVPTSLRGILTSLLSLTSVAVHVRTDPSKMRHAETPVLVGDPTSIAGATGWRPERSLLSTLQDCLDDWRRHGTVSQG